MDYRNSIITFAVLFLLVATPTALALGISTPYWKDHPLEMYAGQTRDVEFLLVNKAGNPTENAFVTLDKDAGIAKITSGTDYSIPAEARNIKVILQIKVPEEANIGDTYDVEFSVKAAPEEEQGGNVQLGVGYGVKFPVIVVPESEAPALPLTEQKNQNISGTSLAVIIIITLAIIFVVYRIKKNKFK